MTSVSGAVRQPVMATLSYERHDGSVETYRVRPYLRSKDDWQENYPSLQDAVKAVYQHNADYDGVAFGVVTAREGAFQLRPLESTNGYGLVIDGPNFFAKSVLGTQKKPALVAMVGLDNWIDLSQPGKTVAQAPQPIQR